MGRNSFRFRFRVALITIAAALLLGAEAEARQATPTVPTLAINAEQCTIAPRPPAELRELAAAGFDTAAAFVRESEAEEATPSAGATPVAGTPLPEATPVSAGAGATPTFGGTPADAATVAAVEETIRQLVACTNAGDFFRLVSVFDDESASGYLGFGVLAFAQVSTGSFDEVPADLDPVLLDGFLAARAIPVPPPPTQRFNSLEVREATRLANGWVIATVAASFGSNEENVDVLRLREEDGRYVIVFFGDDDADATPPATPVA